MLTSLKDKVTKPLKFPGHICQVWDGAQTTLAALPSSHPMPESTSHSVHPAWEMHMGPGASKARTSCQGLSTLATLCGYSIATLPPAVICLMHQDCQQCPQSSPSLIVMREQKAG